MISLTKIAARNFKRIREDEELSEHIPLRVAVKGGGCAGYEYILTFGDVIFDGVSRIFDVIKGEINFSWDDAKHLLCQSSVTCRK